LYWLTEHSTSGRTQNLISVDFFLEFVIVYVVSVNGDFSPFVYIQSVILSNECPNYIGTMLFVSIPSMKYTKLPTVALLFQLHRDLCYDF
jgi:hypothetical protein